jgi:hypothetical protein
MTMITNAVEARYRGGFMSVNAALQQAAGGLSNILAGFLIVREPSGRLAGFRDLGHVSIGFFVLTVLIAARLRTAAPHVSAPTKNTAIAPASPEAVL